MRLEDLAPNAVVRGVLPDAHVTVVSVQWFGSEALELTYKDPAGKVASGLLYRDDESRLEMVEQGRPWSFDADGALFRLVSEAHRIRLAHIFDPLLAVHTSIVEPLPHQITAVYETMLPRQPLRFLLADDPGAGKTIMAGLLMKELAARGDLERCLVVCPGALAEQWQAELLHRFSLPFQIMTNEGLRSAATGNWFLETDLAIARLDMLSRNEHVQEKLRAPECDWDLIVCDEAHKMSATYAGSEVRRTKRHRLGQLLSGLTRHFLLMTATPHNGKERDFQLFMGLLDDDRFEGRFRAGVHRTDVSDLMRRAVKEDLRRFDGRPLFPKRKAHTVPFKLSEDEARLYAAVTRYVREEFNRADTLGRDGRRSTVGFALTVLQRRLASSPEAIHRSLQRRRERLQARLRDTELAPGRRAQRSTTAFVLPRLGLNSVDEEVWDDLEDAPETEMLAAEDEVLGQATAASTIPELRAEIATLRQLERLASDLLRSGDDTKWLELASLMDEVFTPAGLAHNVAEFAKAPYGSGDIRRHTPSPRQKLVVFTEHRDTLDYLHRRISTLLGRRGTLVTIHGSAGREERLMAQEAFRHDPEVKVLLATDAAGEGINLQRAHLMVNYDLPWNPNRLEQRFGRIHRIGQQEVCHLWNLVAADTREGDVYQRLLEKLEQARATLGGKVFNVLGKLHFEGKPLRKLLEEAIRYGEKPEVRDHLNTALDQALDQDKLRELLEEKALAHDAMDASAVCRVREEMERAEARRLQPHYVESFFLEAFRRLGGTAKQREPRRYEVARVPGVVRALDRLGGGRTGPFRFDGPVQPRYERIAFEKLLVSPRGKPPAAFVCPGHPLLDAVLGLTLERNGALLKRGAVLVDERDSDAEPRVLFYLEHAVRDESKTRNGNGRVVSKRMMYVEIDAAGSIHHLSSHAPYLDYRPLAAGEPGPAEVLDYDACAWVTGDLEGLALKHAVQSVVPEHLAEVRQVRHALVDRAEAAVKDRLVKEISHWDHRAQEIKLRERTVRESTDGEVGFGQSAAARRGSQLSAREAAKRADALRERLKRRREQLRLERQISALPPVVLGGVLVVPKSLLDKIGGRVIRRADTQAAAARARQAVMEMERRLGFDPVDREFDRLGYDIESRVPGTGKLRFIEVKGRVAGARTITVTRNEILCSLNKPDDYILALVEFLDGGQHVRYLRRPFQREPDFGVTSVNYDFGELLARARRPA